MMHRMHCIAYIALVCATLLTHARGEDGAATLSSTTVTVTTDAETQTAFSNLQNEQTIFFRAPKLQLSKALHVNGVSNLTIKSVEGTELKCPDGDASITIWEGKNIIIEGFNFTGCRHSSAVQIFGTSSQTKGEKSEGELNFEVTGCSVLVKSCRFNGNTKPSLGNPSVYFGNDPENDNGLGGAAISGYGCDLSIAHTHFHNNSAVNGGAIDLLKGSLHVSETQFEKNRANDTGGAVSLDSLPSVFEKCLIEYNVAGSYAGGVGIYGDDGTFRECTLRSNRADRGGGVAGILSGLTVTNSNFTNNSAASDGAAAYLFGARAIIRDSKFESHTSTHGTIGLGRSNADIERCNFSSNTANSGGALFSYENSQLICKSSNFIDNTATKEHGGAAYVDNSDSEFIGCKFTSNSAERHGGAAYVIRRTTSFHSCEFTKNKAKEFGGGAHIECERANINNCHFEENKVDDLGGAIAVVGGKASIATTRFINNTAKRGGASQFQNVEVGIYSSHFERNVAEVYGGGTLAQLSKVMIEQTVYFQNEAIYGGAIYLEQEANLYFQKNATTSITFKDNKAFDGGALCCHQCGRVTIDDIKTIKFVKNRAVRAGGAVLFEGGYGLLNRNAHLQFRGNVAKLGGALYFENSGELEINYRFWNKSMAEFTDNEATVGGAIFIRSQHETSISIFIGNARFRGNVAQIVTRAISKGEQLFLDRLRKIDEWGVAKKILHSQSYAVAVGGALYAEFLNTRSISTAAFTLSGVNVTENRAAIGGGIYIHDSYRKQLLSSKAACTERIFSVEPCQFIRFERVEVTRNKALVSAGGLFVRDIVGFNYTCDGEISKGIESTKECMHVVGNTVEEGKMPKALNMGTDAATLRVANVYDELSGLIPGKLIKVPANQASPPGGPGHLVPIRIEVLDLFGEIIREPNVDADLKVVLISDYIGGRTEYQAVDGIITINSTRVIAGDIHDQIVVKAADDRPLSTSFMFSTKSCPDGAIKNPELYTCDRCNFTAYAFNDVSECRSCEDNALCVGTTVLVPKNNYWHSTPFAPRMIPCLIDDACTWDNRSYALAEYYQNSTVRMAGLAALENGEKTMGDFAQEYQQCAEPYTGIICGTCAKGYGRSGSGTCRRCNLSKGYSYTISALALLLFAAAFSLKLWIAWKATHTEVFKLNPWKRFRATLNFLILRGSGSRKQNPAGHRRLCSAPLLSSVSSEEPLVTSAEIQPLTNETAKHTNLVSDRSDRPEIRQDKKCDHCGRDGKCLAMEKVTESMFITYEVLMEYMQLNSIAYSLDIDWNPAMKVFLSLQGFFSRMTHVVRAYPFECNFPEAPREKSDMTLKFTFVRLALPFILLSFFVLIPRAWRRVCLWRRGRGRNSKASDIPIVPVEFVFFFGFFSYVLDIAGEFFRILSFTKLNSGNPLNSYDSYDLLDKEYIWPEDASISYFEGAHRTACYISIVGLVCCFGILIYSAVLLYLTKQKGELDSEKFQHRYGYLCSGIEQQNGLALYWMVFITLRNIILSFVATMFSSVSLPIHVRIGLAFLVVFSSYIMLIAVRPYTIIDFSVVFPSYTGNFLARIGMRKFAIHWRGFNRAITTHSLQSAALLMSLCLYGIAGAVEKKGPSRWCSKAVLLVWIYANTMFVLFLLYRIWMAMHSFSDLQARHKGVSFSKQQNQDGCANTYLLHKMWIIWARNIEATRNSSIAEEDEARGGSEDSITEIGDP